MRHAIIVGLLGIVVLGLVLAIVFYLEGILSINPTAPPYIIGVETFRLYFLVFLGGGAVGLTYLEFYFYDRILEAQDARQAKEKMNNVIIFYLIVAVANVFVIVIFPTYSGTSIIVTPLSTNAGLFAFIGSLISLGSAIMLFLRKENSDEAVSFYVVLLLIIPSGFFIILGIISSFQNLGYYSMHPLLNSICLVGLGLSSVILFKLRNIFLSKVQGFPGQRAISASPETTPAPKIPAIPQSEKKELLPSVPKELTRQDRVKTNADYPERWALKHGLKPFERENFQCFEELAIDYQSKHLNANFLHQKISNELENMGYRLLENQMPLQRLQDLDRNSFQEGGIFSLKGQIKAKIRAERMSRRESPNLFLYICSIILIVVGGVGLIFTLFYYPASFLELLIIFLIILGLGVGGLIIYFRITPKTGESVKGWTNIYVLEQGFVSIGSFIREEEKYSYAMPIQSVECIITIAGAVHRMSLSELHKDVSRLKEQIQKFMNQTTSLNAI